ncbi:hypothetical protein [Nesterenkonia alkaliphila]|nr:hypothetical protein [Nesterenkonia alkaliphila]
MSAGVPTKSTVYVGLHEPISESPVHAIATHRLAMKFAEMRPSAETLLFNTIPPTATRIMDTASHDRRDALSNDMQTMPPDLSTNLYSAVRERLEEPKQLRDIDDARAAIELAMRLGYLATARRVLSEHQFSIANDQTRPIGVVGLMLMYKLGAPVEVLERLAIEMSKDTEASPTSRMRCAVFLMARKGRLGRLDPGFEQALARAEEVTEETLNTETEFQGLLLKQAFLRAAAFQPFLLGNEVETMRTLEQAVATQESARQAQGFDEVQWRDFAFPLYETLAKTASIYKNHSVWLESTKVLTEVNPGDARAWIARGNALAAKADFEQAVESYRTVETLGGSPTAPARYFTALALLQMEDREGAFESVKMSLLVDPTAEAAKQLHSALRQTMLGETIKGSRE